MSLFHVLFEQYSNEYKEHYKTHSEIINNRDSENLRLVNSLKKNIENTSNRDSILSITQNFVKDYNSHISKVKQELTIYHNIKKDLAIEHSFRGRTSFRFWLAYFGITIGFLFFSIKSLYDDIVSGSTYRFQFLSLSGVIISVFWSIHFIFLTQKDFRTNKYILLLVLCGILVSFFTYFVVKFYAYKDDIILSQLTLIERIKTIHYPKMVVRSKYFEKYGEPVSSDKTIKEDIDQYQNDINKFLKL
ncbi:hypothetical protein SAMN04489761_4640 [Tenacibaculum sp. MAR_2009_124]|uniref:hypothetical protein n=1 Tax=Tenacibaculum sp. MAR_2009_124 TaxID=1250059 RepID=UPI0008989A16|nr:hypothetical protein [Tenacibaculum sp. MAR_2009_124]SED21234.1 hypothetical protein SAMN04489761_4640 [Tenacibaculum sp. MAR_2009_124]